MLTWILLLFLVLLIFGAVPTWPHRRRWGWGPSGILGALLVLLLVGWLLGVF
jgi:hypothetical protein